MHVVGQNGGPTKRFSKELQRKHQTHQDRRTGVHCLGTGADLTGPAAGAGRTLLK